MAVQAEVGDRLESITLKTADGEPVELDSLLTRPTVVVLVRYFGCMPCQAYLKEISAHLNEFTAAGAAVIGVGGAADYQARHLTESGVNFPLLLDPSHSLYNALDLKRFPWWRLLTPETWWRYLKAARTARQGRITAHPLQSPGLAILATDGTIKYLHRGHTLGHYPPVEEVLNATR
ncbi:AhpC/TSA family protein [Hoyosella sp. YIM 151337]|uniref:peroxiredoxin-like family protein n=1 Tax=Hoyosella sp. YIM 151337 TaxID=2992742 RepID=UPI0022358AE4|nr:peroxiredoxin-like family protein [Hoyosella sp. YIM 151337]MCW4355876.1 AhpC/TSA family protein [Hoyosella sp. YIM 151337]